MTSGRLKDLSYKHSVPIFEHSPFTAPTIVPPFLKRTATSIKTFSTHKKSMSNSVSKNLSFNRLGLLLSIAHSTLLKPGQIDITSEINGLIYQLLRHIADESNLGYEVASKVGSSKPAKLPLAEFLRSSMHGRIGNGIAGLYARSEGAMYIAHFEDVQDLAKIQQNHMISVVKQLTGIVTVLSRTPDFITVNRKDEFGIMEAKASGLNKSRSGFLTDPLLKALREQVDPFVDGEISIGTGFPVKISRGHVCGIRIGHPAKDTEIHIFEVDSSTPPLSSPHTSYLAVLHFNSWVKMLGNAFWNTDSSLSRLESIRIGRSNFVLFSINLDSNYIDDQSAWHDIFGIGFLGASVCNPSGPSYSILIGIERSILLQLIGIRGEQTLNALPSEELHQSVVSYINESYENVNSILSIIDSRKENDSGPWKAYFLFLEGVVAFQGLNLTLLRLGIDI